MNDHIYWLIALLNQLFIYKPINKSHGFIIIMLTWQFPLDDIVTVKSVKYQDRLSNSFSDDFSHGINETRRSPMKKPLLPVLFNYKHRHISFKKQDKLNSLCDSDRKANTPAPCEVIQFNNDKISMLQAEQDVSHVRGHVTDQFEGRPRTFGSVGLNRPVPLFPSHPLYHPLAHPLLKPVPKAIPDRIQQEKDIQRTQPKTPHESGCSDSPGIINAESPRKLVSGKESLIPSFFNKKTKHARSTETVPPKELCRIHATGEKRIFIESFSSLASLSKMCQASQPKHDRNEDKSESDDNSTHDPEEESPHSHLVSKVNRSCLDHVPSKAEVQNEIQLKKENSNDNNSDVIENEHRSGKRLKGDKTEMETRTHMDSNDKARKFVQMEVSNDKLSKVSLYSPNTYHNGEKGTAQIIPKLKMVLLRKRGLRSQSCEVTSLRSRQQEDISLLSSEKKSISTTKLDSAVDSSAFLNQGSSSSLTNRTERPVKSTSYDLPKLCCSKYTNNRALIEGNYAMFQHRKFSRFSRLATVARSLSSAKTAFLD